MLNRPSKAAIASPVGHLFHCASGGSSSCRPVGLLARFGLLQAQRLAFGDGSLSNYSENGTDPVALTIVHGLMTLKMR